MAKTARDAAQELVKAIYKDAKTLPIMAQTTDLSEAVYTLNEGRGWNREVELDEEVVLRCWRLVEYLKQNRLPAEWKM